jgi:TetR/AcrR family transcriptional repressor of nem operon
MARPIEFDKDKALDRALLLFWEKGYQATSLQDLLQELGISRSSLYAAFGDKRNLFIECLDLFAERTQLVLLKAGQGRPALEALQFFFERHLNGPGRSKSSLGCLLVNTVLEMAGVDDNLADRASRHLADIQRLFEHFLRDAHCPHERAPELAAMLMLLNEGIRVASRRRLGVREQLDPIAATFRMLRREITQATP